MPSLNELDAEARTNTDRHINELIALCAQPSIAAQNVGMRECAELVSDMLRTRGFEIKLLPTRGYPVVFGERTGRSDRTLIFYNHYDVQPPEPLELWDSAPFEPSIRDGKVFARGVSDDKGHILCRLAAIDAFLAVEDDLPCNVKFIIEGEEEIGSPNLPEFIKDNADVLAGDACIWEFGGVDHEGAPVQVAGLRGICYVELSVETATQDAHSGLGGSIFPNAAWRLIWALNSLKDSDELIRIPGFYDRVVPPTELDLELLAKLPDSAEEYRLRYGIQSFVKGLTGGLELERETIFSPTCTICGLTSGYQGEGTKTVLPAKARAKVDFRLVPDQDPDEVLLLLSNHLDEGGFRDIEINYLAGEHPARTDPNDPFLKLVVETARDVYGEPQRIIPMSGGSGPNHPFIHDLKVPVATAGVGYPGSNVHAPNENMDIENFIAGVRHTIRIMDSFSRGP
jgi:acetylornithine deacetylase/succinyl-diaminopimelate desuccinylase-like protein